MIHDVIISCSRVVAVFLIAASMWKLSKPFYKPRES